MAGCVIEELDSDQFRFDQDLERMFHEHERRPKELLATVFDFLDRKSPFFRDPNVSKTLARLLRDVKNKSMPAAAPTAPKPADHQSKESEPEPVVQVCTEQSTQNLLEKSPPLHGIGF
jgi:hypothetical protein